MKPRTSGVKKIIGAVFLIALVGGVGYYYIIDHRGDSSSSNIKSKTESSNPVTQPDSKSKLEVSKSKVTIEVSSPSDTTPIVIKTLNELKNDIQLLKEEVKHSKPDDSKTQELVKVMERLDAIYKSVKTMPEQVTTEVGKQLTSVKQDIINAVHFKIQEEVKQLQTQMNEPTLAQLKQMFAELNVKLDKRDQNVAEVKQAINELQSKLNTQFIATLAEIRQLINSSPVKEDIEVLKQAVVITRTVQLKQIADTLVLKAENNVIKQILEAFAQQLTVLPFAVEEKQYPRLEFKIDYYYQRRGQGIPQELTENTVLLKGDEFYVTFNPAQRSYVYILQTDVLGECSLLYPDLQDNFNPVQPKATGRPYEIRNFVVKDVKPGTETILFRATQQPHPQLEKSVGHNQGRLKPEYCRPPVTLPTTSPIRKVGTGGGQLLCEDCASVLTFIYH
jgi:hypothetical protein